MLTTAEAAFAAAMAAFQPFERSPKLAVAVSGGADSMALLLLLQQWCLGQDGRLVALSVDHQLRAESQQECETVAGWAGRYGIFHQTLTWRGVKPQTGLQNAARTARYRLLGDYCRAQGILHLVTGHHRQDQVETLQLRHASGSTAYGLAGMPTLALQDGLRLLRPLLHFPSEDLHHYLRGRHQSWLQDPSNQDRRFARARLRQPDAKDDGVLRIAALRNRVDRQGLEAAIDRALADCVVWQGCGAVALDRGKFCPLEKSLGAALLRRLLWQIGDNAYPPKGAEDLFAAMQDSTGQRISRAKCLLCHFRNRLWILPEPGRRPDAQSVTQPGLYHWGDLQIRLHARAFRNGPLQLGHWQKVRRKQLHSCLPEGLKRCLNQHPIEFFQGLPQFRTGAGEMLLPDLGYADPPLRPILPHIVLRRRRSSSFSAASAFF